VSNNTHWHSFVATLTKSHLENEKIVDFFGKRLQIETKYAEALTELSKSEVGRVAPPKPSKPLAPGTSMLHCVLCHVGSSMPCDEEDLNGESCLGTKQQQDKNASVASKVAVPALNELLMATDCFAAKLNQFTEVTRTKIVEEKIKNMVSGNK